MNIANEIIDKLQLLKGINLDVAFRVFREKKIECKRSGFVENIIAMQLDRELPKNGRGMDFKGLFEVKEMKVKYTKKGKMRNGGDTNISGYLNSEPNFFESNIWDKSNSILIVCVDSNRVIVDVRYFDGSNHSEQMNNDYERIKEHKNLCRKNNKILVFKTGYNSIMLKGNVAIDMSDSILDNEPVNIINQDLYIHDLLDAKWADYQEKIKSRIEKMALLMNSMSINELKTIIQIAEKKINQSVGFDMNAGSELSF